MKSKQKGGSLIAIAKSHSTFPSLIISCTSLHNFSLFSPCPHPEIWNKDELSHSWKSKHLVLAWEEETEGRKEKDLCKIYANLFQASCGYGLHKDSIFKVHNVHAQVAKKINSDISKVLRGGYFWHFKVFFFSIEKLAKIIERLSAQSCM